jgi:hypothetical protein
MSVDDVIRATKIISATVVSKVIVTVVAKVIVTM